MKSRLILWTIVFFLATPLWMRIGWEFSPKRPLSILIMDKTVMDENSYKHRSVNWILDHEKYTKPDGNFYDINKDYYGFFPGQNEKYTIRDLEKMNDPEVDSVSKVYDIAYFTDTYGILGNEWYKHRDIHDRSQSIYGGLSEKDLLLMRKMKEHKKPVLAEFNSIGYPTPLHVRKEFESHFAIEWTGWMARYITSLDTVNNPDLPAWIVRNYKKENGGIWRFKKAGMLFVHEDGRVIVLEEGSELEDAIPVIITEKKYQAEYEIPAVLIYPYWTDIMVNKSDSNEIVSRYKIGTTPSGEELLAKNNIPKIYPAIIRRKGDFSFHYFCGDFADNPTKFRFAKLDGISALKFLMYNAVDKTDRNRFFWEFYLPMMQNILKTTYENKKS